MRLLSIAERWALAIWAGSLAGFAFIFAPVAFARLSGDLDTFAAIVAGTLGALTMLGYGCGALSLAASAAGLLSLRTRRTVARMICVALMLGLTTFEQRTIVPAMTEAQASFHASFNAVPVTDPRRIRYDALHAESSRVYGAVLILGLAALALAP